MYCLEGGKNLWPELTLLISKLWLGFVSFSFKKYDFNIDKIRGIQKKPINWKNRVKKKINWKHQIEMKNQFSLNQFSVRSNFYSLKLACFGLNGF